MATRIVEGKLPYTGGDAIQVDSDKVISLLLREENNLIHLNADNEIYTDLQLATDLTPSSTFPVGVTVGKVLQSDGWSQNGLLLNWKTTSGDYARWIYANDGEIYFDGGNGTWTHVYYSSEVDDLFTALRGDLATVAFTGDYNDLINRPAFLQEQADWSQTDTDAPDYIKNKPTIPTVNDATLTIQKNGTAVATFTANSNTATTANITVPNIQNSLTSTSTSDGLSAYQGKVLKDALDDLKAIGRFLSLWDSTTGQPISFPESIPYNYKTGDYFIVETVSSAIPAVNYKPTGVQYTGTASTTQETDEVEVGDFYLFDGATWLLQINHGKTVSFANLAGQPSDNAALANALNAKADDNAVVHLAGAETVTGQKTFTQPTKIQSGDATGALILGADLNTSVVSANNRKMARMGMPSFDNTAPVTIISGDSQNASVNLVDFGGNPLASGSVAPDFIRFVVAQTHGSTEGDKINMLEVSNYEGNDLNHIQHTKGISLNAKTMLSNAAIPTAGDNSNKVPSTSWVQGELADKQDTLTLPATPTQGNLVVRGADNETLADGGEVPNTKTFYASTSADWNTTLGQAIYDWVSDGNYAILQYGLYRHAIFTPTNTTTGTVSSGTHDSITVNSSDEIESDMTVFIITVASGTVTAVSAPVTQGILGQAVPAVGSNGQVLTVVSGVAAWANASGGDVQISTQANNILTSGAKIWAGTQSDYENLGSYDTNTVYLTI